MRRNCEPARAAAIRFPAIASLEELVAPRLLSEIESLIGAHCHLGADEGIRPIRTAFSPAGDLDRLPLIPLP